MLKRLGKNGIVLAFWLLVWAALAGLVGRELLLPGPLAVLKRLFTLAQTADFWLITAVSLGRILLGAVIGVAAGTLLAVLTSRFKLVDALFNPLLSIVRSTPVASFILLVLIWVGRDILPMVIVVLMVMPVVWGNVSAGIAATDGKLLQMAKLYRFGVQRTVTRVYVPAVMPHFLSACRTSLGLAWKAGVAAEVLTVPQLSIGRHLYEAKLYLETVDLFAWTVVVIALSLLIEKLLAAAIGHIRTGGAA
ncbi:MAG: ABC transporter permease [Oscillospiraceae bacterium]